MKSVIVGTAGHIDHGKTSLVKALTGIDADRLEEEKRRGITIDIGFAHLELPAPNGETLRLGFVDVVVLVIAADEGIKPQTREHFDICRLLAVRRGLTVLTKSDTVGPETLEVARLQVADFLRASFLDPSHSPIVAASSLTGAGLDQVKIALARIASEVSPKDATALARLPVDRVFTMKGFGTVVTGTLVSGTIRKEEELEVFPSGKRVRIRGVQVHGSAAEAAIAGQRTALNVTGVSTEDLARGMTLAPADMFHSASRIDTRLSLLSTAKPLRDTSRVHFHAYTMETIAEVRLYGAKQLSPGEDAFAQVRLAEPMLVLPGDRFVIRQFSPVATIGGGVVVDTSIPPSRRRAEEVTAFLNTLLTGSPQQMLAARVARAGVKGLFLNDAQAQMNIRRAQVEQLASRARLPRCGELLISSAAFAQAGTMMIDTVRQFHDLNPLVAGMRKEELRDRLKLGSEVFSGALGKAIEEKQLTITRELVHLPGRGIVMKDDEAESKKMIEEAFAVAGLKVPSLREVLAGLKVDKVRAQQITTLLLRDKVLVKISEDLVFHQNSLTELRQRVAALKSTTSRIDVARFKDMTGVTRKYAIPLLEYLDRERVTRRVGDERVIL
jgi:selenocysteine-specific elongation factor